MIKHKFLTLFVAFCATTALWASNTITYTATEELTGYNFTIGKTTFGPPITSHDFSNGTGTITCDGEITTIGEWAFYYCSGLASITIPNSVTTIGERAFADCYGLTSITIPNSVTTIGDGAFSYCYGLTSITIGNSVTWIGNFAFSNCTGLTSVTIPNSVTTIGDDAFFWCSGLTSITIPNSVTTIGGGAFADCRSLISIDVDAANTHFVSVDGVLFNYAKDTLIQYPAGNSRTEYTIPNSVTTIGDEAFHGCSKLASVTIGNSVTTIGEYAFYECSGLTSVTIPNSVTTIGNSAFRSCHSLTSITIPNSVTTIGEYAFYWCKGLTSISVDAANTHYASIDGVLFNYAKDTLIQYPIGNPRAEYIIPNSVTTIGDGAFYCSSLTSITIPNSVTTIGNWAFSGCSGLTSVTIGNSVTTIGDYAFADCYGLTSVTIPNSVTTIEWGAFFDCSGLTSVTCEATTPPACGYSCFNGVAKYIPLYVPAGSIEAYQVTEQWKDFTDIRPITAKDVEVTEIEAEPTESAVEIAWPSVVNAETYTIEIRLNDKLICSIVFNAQGQLVSINFNLAPGRGGHTYATTAESTATGWAYTIAGLNPGTNYTYSVIAKNADEQVIDTKSGSFTTKGVTAIENVSADVNTTKFLHNGQVIIRKGNKTYNTLGQEIK